MALDSTDMTRGKKLMRSCLLGLAFILFDRSKAAWFCIAYVLVSFMAERYLGWAGFFSCSGAIVTLAGLFLNIKHSLNFHLKIPIIGLYNKLAGAGVYGTSVISKEQAEWAEGIISDEMFGVSFMIIGTLLWAYGSYFFVIFK